MAVGKKDLIGLVLKPIKLFSFILLSFIVLFSCSVNNSFKPINSSLEIAGR